MESANTLSVVKATVRVGCHVDVIEKDVLALGPNFNKSLVVTVKLYNEGELPASALQGDWKLLPARLAQKNIFPIERDFLGAKDYLDTQTIEGSQQWRREGIRFDVKVEFWYSIPTEPEKRHYQQTFRYDHEHGVVVRIDENVADDAAR